MDKMQEQFDTCIGRLDRVLSELVAYGKGVRARNEAGSGQAVPYQAVVMDEHNQQTLKHHAEDMVMAAGCMFRNLGQTDEDMVAKVLELLGVSRHVQTIQTVQYENMGAPLVADPDPQREGMSANTEAAVKMLSQHGFTVQYHKERDEIWWYPPGNTGNVRWASRRLDEPPEEAVETAKRFGLALVARVPVAEVNKEAFFRT